MPAVAPYIPPTDPAFDAWSANFSSLLTATPPLYGLAPGDASAVATAVAAWHAAYLLCTSPSTKTKAAVADKNTQRTNCQAILRPYAQAIANNAGVAPTDKTAIGVNARTSVPSPITAPTTYPVVSVVSALPLQHVLRYRDQLASPSVKSKPYGAIQCQLVGSASATPITDPAALGFLQNATKTPFLQTWPSGSTGKVAYYAARWGTRTGLFGPWSAITSMVIP